MKAIQELGYGTNAKLMVGYKSRLWQEANSDGSTYTDLPYQNTWDTSLGQPGKSGIITNFTGGKQGLEVGKGSPESQAANFVEQFDKVFPGSKAAYNQKAVRFHWPSYPFTLGSYACYKPGQYTAFRGAEGEAVGNLHFAGEHTSLESQGYMNGASESGERVAQEILESVKVK
jgi:monoamine oxidase